MWQQIVDLAHNEIVAYLGMMLIFPKHLVALGGLGLWLLGCSQAPPKDSAAPGCEDGPLRLELAQRDGFPIAPQAPIQYGHPPQGGVPYAPYEVRFRGVSGADEGVTVQIEVTEVSTRELLGDVRLSQRFLCSNIGADEGHWVGGEVHVRFWQYDLDSLLGREAEVEAIVFAADGAVLDASMGLGVRPGLMSDRS